MAKNSTDFVGYTCGKVHKQVQKLDLSYLAAEIEAGDLTIEEALRRAAHKGADIAQLHGAEVVRAAFDGYISRVEKATTPRRTSKVRSQVATINLICDTEKAE